MTERLPLQLITFDAGTQQRPIDPDVVLQYLSLMQDGVKFPPVEVVSDGQKFWLTDGFHRYRCARERGEKGIAANVTSGTLRDALWLSFSANRQHGFPRQPGVAGRIIVLIFADATWSTKSLSAIARHVGVTRQYIAKIRDEIIRTTPGEQVNLGKPAEEDADSEPETQAHRATSCTIDRAEKVEVTRRGTTYRQRSQEKERKPVRPPTDGTGRVIPDHLRQLYAGQSIIKSLLRDLSCIRDSVKGHLDDKDPTFTLLNVTRFQADYENLRRTLNSALPYAVCPYCGGDAKDCKACQGFGLLNKHTYEAAPRELKP